MAISLHAASDRDVEALCEIYYDFHEFHVCGVPTHLRSLGNRERWDRSALRNALRKIIRSDVSAIFVAKVAGELAGLIEVHVRQDPGEATLVPHRYAEIQSLIVSSSFRRRGIGTQLVRAARQWAQENRMTEIRLSVWEFNQSAREFYESAGFKTLQRRMVAAIPAPSPAGDGTRPG